MPKKKTLIKGHEVHWDEAIGRYRYADGEIVKWSDPRPCPACGLNPKDYGNHDPCIANLPGVRRACCGHGVQEGILIFEDETIIKGFFKVGKSKRWRKANASDS